MTELPSAPRLPGRGAAAPGGERLLDLDSSLTARKRLAEELGVNAGPHGSAEQNIALHKMVLRKLAENGGKVPDSLKGRP